MPWRSRHGNCLWKHKFSWQRNQFSVGKEIWGYKKKEAPVLAPHQIPMHIQSTFTRGCCPSVAVIVHTAADCYFRKQSLVLNAVTPTNSAPCFDKEKREYLDSFERFTMSVAQVVNCGNQMWVICVYSVTSLLCRCMLVTVCVSMHPVSASLRHF